MATVTTPAYEFDGPAVAKRLAALLKDAAKGSKSRLIFSAKFIAPENLIDEVKECHSLNCTLTAKIRLAVGSNKKRPPVEIPIPYPYHGVFVMGNGNGRFNRPAEARLMVWHPCLVRRPGLWFLRKYKSDGSTEVFAELGLLPGKSVSTGSTNNDNKFRMLLSRECCEGQFFKTENADKKVRAAFEKVLIKLGGSPEPMLSWNGCVKLLKPIKGALKAAKNADGVFDDDDLATKRLYTYGVFLAEHLAQLVGNKFFKKAGKTKGKKKADLDGAALGAEIRNRMSYRRGYVWMRPFESRNAAEAVSCLTAFERYGWGGDLAASLPAIKRQIHPSFKGFVCPVQTPESPHVGLSLNLAAGVTADAKGVLSAPADTDGLGYAASLLPFFQHTDAARAMMGAKNYVQALPVRETEPPLVTTGAEISVRELLSPLAEARLLPEDDRFYAPGLNLIVAYMPWFGLNYNDAIVANADLADRMAAERTEKRTQYLEPGSELEEYFGVEPETRLHCIDQRVEEDSVIAYVHGADGCYEVRCGMCGTLKSVRYHRPIQGSVCGGLIEWTVETRHRLGAGDKLMGRHGNKGVISVMLPPGEMPHLPEDDRLGALSGRAVDLILNPLGVISRMNVGQLLETHTGLLLKLGVEGVPTNMGKPFLKVDAESLRGLLSGVNKGGGVLVDGLGRVPLAMPSHEGEPVTLESPVVVGVQYFVRLDHIPAEKAHFRGRGESLRDYDPVTGQATQGKSRNGGQRLGEMEMWALDAYGADKLVRRVCKDVVSLNSVQGESANEGQTFRAIRAFLFAFGLNFRGADAGKSGGYQLRWTGESDITGRGKEVRRINNTPATKRAALGTFKCSKCGYSIDDVKGTCGGKSDYSLCVEDLLRDKGVVLADCDYNKTFGMCEYPVVLTLADPPRSLSVKVKNGPSALHVEIEIDGTEYHAYRREVKEEIRIADLLALPVTCNRVGSKKEKKHSISPLSCTSPVSMVTVRAMGGLADPNVFGAGGSRGWGFVRLGQAVSVAGGKNGWAKNWPAQSVIPVLPWCYRKGYPLEDGTEQPSPLTKLYEQLADAVLKQKGKRTRNAKGVQKAVGKLFCQLKSELGGKYGLIRRDGLGRRMDNSGRFVVVPDPDLKWDECGFDLEVLIVMFKGPMTAPGFLEDVLKRMATATGTPSSSRVELFNEALSCLHMYKWPERIPDKQRILVKIIIQSYLFYREPLVLVNRSPTLHRYNIKALRPVVINRRGRSLDDLFNKSRFWSEPAYVISVNPLICQSMGCDYDGDEMSLHLVHPDDAGEAARMLPSARGNLLSLASLGPVAEFDQDMVLGTYLMSLSQDRREKFLSEILVEGCPECRRIVSKEAWDADVCRNLLSHLCARHPGLAVERIPLWMRKAFDVVTRSGISFGYFDLLACKPEGRLIEEIFAKKMASKSKKLQRSNTDLTKAAEDRLSEILGKKSSREPGFSVAAMAWSKARGDKQIRQLVAARGYLDPGKVSFHEDDDKKFIHQESLVSGMSSETAFWAAMNGRSTMTDKKLATGQAGYLTRMMVMACWPWRVTAGDCGSTADKRSPATCGKADHKQVCAECYGKLPDGTLAPEGYPAGLIAAQSIGERGTQLSMKGFHTGSHAVDIAEVDKRMNEKGLFAPAKGPKKFLAKLKAIAAYANIDVRHFQLLWRIVSLATPKTTLDGAVACEGESDLFAGLAGGGQWGLVSKHLAGREAEGVCADATGKLARIMVGSPASGRKRVSVPPETDGEGRHPETQTPEPDNGDEKKDNPNGLPASDPPKEADLLKSDCDLEEADEEVAAMPERRPSQMDAPPDKAVISLVVREVGGAVQCRTETPVRRKSDSNPIRLAEAFAAWATREQNPLLTRQPLDWRFKTRKQLAKHFKSLDVMKNLLTDKNMSEFINLTYLYWDDACLPLGKLFDKEAPAALKTEEWGTTSAVEAESPPFEL